MGLDNESAKSSAAPKEVEARTAQNETKEENATKSRVTSTSTPLLHSSKPPKTPLKVTIPRTPQTPGAATPPKCNTTQTGVLTGGLSQPSPLSCRPPSAGGLSHPSTLSSTPKTVPSPTLRACSTPGGGGESGKIVPFFLVQGAPRAGSSVGSMLDDGVYQKEAQRFSATTPGKPVLAKFLG
jgi:hypothetical protein